MFVAMQVMYPAKVNWVIHVLLPQSVTEVKKTWMKGLEPQGILKKMTRERCPMNGVSTTRSEQPNRRNRNKLHVP